MSKSVEELEGELAAIKAEMAALKASLPGQHSARKPWPRIDYTANATMPSQAVAEMAQAVSDGVIADTVRQLRIPAQPSGLIKGGSGGAKQIGRNGWLDETPNKPPPGIELIDRLVDAQDQIDRAERIRRFKDT